MTDIYSISYITKYLKDLIEKDPLLSEFWVRGEISNWTRARSGHCYFTLKDEEAEVRCVMWKSVAAQLPILPREGDEVVARGRLSIYAQRGSYQFYVEEMQPIGQGVLYRRFEALKARLAKEGLFDEWRKKEIPTFPKRIGVVSSPTAAALRDILNVLRRRQPMVEVILSPTLVQGVNAPPQIVRALRRFEQVPVDLILVARGGGTIEDLWAFNEEIVARAIAACTTPIISGVGHEVDFTIADFVADKRAPTPSAAAELAVPDVREWRERLDGITMGLQAAMRYELEQRQQLLQQEVRALERLNPITRLNEDRQRLDSLIERLDRSIHNRLQIIDSHLAGLEGRLWNLNPKATLARGYAIVTDNRTGHVIQQAGNVMAGQTVKIQLSDGAFKATAHGPRRPWRSRPPSVPPVPSQTQDDITRGEGRVISESTQMYA